MDNYTIREATLEDVEFLVEAIIAAEKGASETLSYSTIFGLSEEETSNYMKDMLEEEIDGCELSVSSYMVVEKDEKIVATMGCWIEGAEDGIPSSTIKGNLLGYTLPNEILTKAVTANKIISEVSLDYIVSALCVGIVYVSSAHRGHNLVTKLLDAQTQRLAKNQTNLTLCIQVFGNNIRAISAYKKLGFTNYKTVQTTNDEVLKYLPDSKKILLIKEI